MALRIFYHKISGGGRDSALYEVAASGSATWETVRYGSPGVFKFSVTRYETGRTSPTINTIAQDKNGIVPGTGDVVMAYDDSLEWSTNGKAYPLFYGFIFTASYKENEIAYTAYDQLRYLKSKDTMVFPNVTADTIVRACLMTSGCKTGSVESTKYRMTSRIEENTSYFDMIQNALDLELLHTGNLYVLYDNFGWVNLEKLEALRTDALLDETSISEKEETSTIDDRYTMIKLIEEDKKSGKRKIYTASKKELQHLYGRLQYFGEVQQGEDGDEKAKMLLDLYSSPSRTFTIQKAAGDPRVHAGCSVIVNCVTDAGGSYNYTYALVERCTHTYEGNFHTMKLELRGGVYSA